jgi:hypothetical protein
MPELAGISQRLMGKKAFSLVIQPTHEIDDHATMHLEDS